MRNSGFQRAPISLLLQEQWRYRRQKAWELKIMLIRIKQKRTKRTLFMTLMSIPASTRSLAIFDRFNAAAMCSAVSLF